MNSQINNIYHSIFQNHYSNVYELNLDTLSLYEYHFPSTKPISTMLYEDWINNIASSLKYIHLKQFMQETNTAFLCKQLDSNPNYIILYQTKEDGINKNYQLVFSYPHENSNSIYITRQDVTIHMQQYFDKVIELQKDSERFRFIISNLCENFGEIDVHTGNTWMTTCNNWEVSQGTLKAQIDWFAENLIIPEQKEKYINDFELSNFVKNLRDNNGFYAPMYEANYPEGKRYLLIVNALLSNPVNPSEEYIFGFVQDITPLKMQEEKNKRLVDISNQLLTLSQTDSLTDLYNRTAGEEIISSHFSTDSSSLGTLLIIDIDYFKTFNDYYGHPIGDAVLKYLGKCMKSVFHSSDILCRWGGDEFVIYMPDTISESAVKKLISKLQTMMNQHMHNASPLPITLSIGGIINKSNISLQTVYKEADNQLYKVKKQGRNSFLLSQL